MVDSKLTRGLTWTYKILFMQASELEQAMCEVSAVIADREINNEDVETYVDSAKRIKHFLKPTISLKEWEAQCRGS